MTMDCVDPERMGRFWAQALGYVPAPSPRAYQSWEEWFDAFDVALDERNEMAALVDPAGLGPALSLLLAPCARRR